MKGRFGARFIARMGLAVVKAAAQQVLSALGQTRESCGLAELELPAPPVAVPRPGAGPLPWEAARLASRSFLVESAPVDDISTRPAEQLATPEPAGRDDPEIAEDGEEPEVRRCQRCTRDLPEQWFAPSHWAAANRSGANKRACMRCAPHTTPAGQRFCNTCERAKDRRAFGPAKGGKVERVCKSCHATQGRLDFFLQGSQGKSRTQ